MSKVRTDPISYFRDPLAEEGGGNLYGYVKNQPLKDVDSFGLQATSPLDALGKGLSGLAKLDASVDGAAALEAAFDDCRKVPHSPSFMC